MKRRVENLTVEDLNKKRAQLSFPEYQREKSLWTTGKKSLLIDSILRDIDIPKLYFNQLKDHSIEVIDGQQRLWSIWEFLDDAYPHKSDGATHKFSELSLSKKQKILHYLLQVTVFEEAEDDYLRMLFVRLQLGLLLNTGEKLHAATGKMKHLVFDNLAKHRFIENLGIAKRRYARETLCAQIAINSFAREKQKTFARTRYDDLEHFFQEYADPRGKDLLLLEAKTKAIPAVMNNLWNCFGAKTKGLTNRSYILSVYLFMETLADNGAATLTDGQRKLFADFVIKLWERLRQEMRKGMDRQNRELYLFETLISSAPGEAYQIQRRHEKLDEYYRLFEKTKKIKGDR